ncbi:MAG: hypothetical protein SOZ17_03210 [Agathobacter sp.]|nr:hypothetical protein [Agathobacter sp.]
MKWKKRIAWVLSFAMILIAVFANSQNVKAEGEEGNGQSVSVDFTDRTVSGNTVTYMVGTEEVSLTLTNPINPETKTATLSVDDVFTVSENFDANTMELVAYVENDFQTSLTVTTSGTGKTSSLNSRVDGGGYPDNIKLVIREKGGNQGGGNQGGGNPFTETVYFVWKGAGDKLCFHNVMGLVPITEGVEYVNYIKEEDVKDDTTQEPLRIADIGADYYWMWDSATAILGNYSSFSSLQQVLENREDESLKRTYAIDPRGAENGNSTICTNGDGVFHATIYSAGFVGVDFDVAPEHYEYLPDYWDPSAYSSAIDVSGTTQEVPAVFEMFVLNEKIHFSGHEGIGAAITNVQVLEVPNGAVTITEADGGYDVTFHSNFFDRVVLKLTTASGECYLKIIRTAIQVSDNFGPNMTETPKAIAKVYYPEGESYEKYEVYATIYYSDDTSVMKKAGVSEIKVDNLGHPVAPGTYMLEGGKGLKYSNYEVEISEDVVGVAFNVVKAGALTGETYSGSYIGSGDGVYYDPEKREMIY